MLDLFRRRRHQLHQVEESQRARQADCVHPSDLVMQVERGRWLCTDCGARWGLRPGSDEEGSD